LCSYHKNGTCCQFVRSQGGCVKAVKHVEDLGYSAIVAKFPVHKETLEIIQQTHARKNGVGEAAAEISAEEELQMDDRYIVHRVGLTDTLIGIALYYQVKIEDIQKVNNLDSHQIFHHKILLIPRPNVNIVRPERQIKEQTEEQIKARRERQIKLFQQLARISEDEAKYYMEGNNYQVEQAMAQLKKDEEWQQQDQKLKQDIEDQKRETRSRRKARACC